MGDMGLPLNHGFTEPERPDEGRGGDNVEICAPRDLLPAAEQPVQAVTRAGEGCSSEGTYRLVADSAAADELDQSVR